MRLQRDAQWLSSSLPPGLQVWPVNIHITVRTVHTNATGWYIYTGASGSVVVRMRSSLSAAAGPTTRLPVPLPALTRVAIISSFCFLDLGAALPFSYDHRHRTALTGARQGREGDGSGGA